MDYVIIMYMSLDLALNLNGFSIGYRPAIITEQKDGQTKSRAALCSLSRTFSFFFLASFSSYYSTLQLDSPFCCLVITNSGSTLLSATLQALCSAVSRERRGFCNKCRLNRLYQPRKFSVSRNSHLRSL